MRNVDIRATFYFNWCCVRFSITIESLQLVPVNVKLNVKHYLSNSISTMYFNSISLCEWLGCVFGASTRDTSRSARGSNQRLCAFWWFAQWARREPELVVAWEDSSRTLAWASWNVSTSSWCFGCLKAIRFRSWWAGNLIKLKTTNSNSSSCTVYKILLTTNFIKLWSTITTISLILNLCMRVK